MRNYITATFERMDLRQIREFLLYDTEESGTEIKDYASRLKQASDPIYKRIENIYSEDASEMSNATTELAQALSARDEVYMEIGMKAGARLIHQLLLTDNPTPPSQE